MPLQFRDRYSPCLQQSLHQPYSCVGECLEMCSWHWTISSVKCVPGCNPLYPTSIVYRQHSQIFSCAGYRKHTVLSLQLINSLLLKRVVVFWGHVLWARLQGIQPERRKCLRHVLQCLFLCRSCVGIWSSHAWCFRGRDFVIGGVCKAREYGKRLVSSDSDQISL